MYEGLFLGSLKYSKEDILYRGSRMSRKEVKDIKNPFIEWKKTKNNMLPNFLLYSRTFLSFLKVKNNINKFLGKTDKNYYGVVYVLKNNKSILNKYSSNADIEFLSIYPEEKEVLFFPYTTFCLNDISEEKYENQNCIIIELDYLGKYEYIYNEFKQDENFQNDFINSFYFFGRNYSSDAMKSGLFDINDYIEENKEDENNNNHKGIKLINDLKNILNKLKNLNSELITIQFRFCDGHNYKIKCSPYITIDELITYFLQSFNSKLALKELKEKISFLHNGQTLNNFGSETINKMKINDLDIIIVVDEDNDIDKKDREEEEEYYQDLVPKEKSYYTSIEELTANENSNDIDIETWTLIFEKKENLQRNEIKISYKKTVKDAINSYIENYADSKSLQFKFNNKPLNLDLEICQSGLQNNSLIEVIKEDLK